MIGTDLAVLVGKICWWNSTLDSISQTNGDNNRWVAAATFATVLRDTCSPAGLPPPCEMSQNFLVLWHDGISLFFWFVEFQQIHFRKTQGSSQERIWNFYLVAFADGLAGSLVQIRWLYVAGILICCTYSKKHHRKHILHNQKYSIRTCHEIWWPKKPSYLNKYRQNAGYYDEHTITSGIFTYTVLGTFRRFQSKIKN